MDRLSSVMLRAALVWLLAGLATGAAMLTDRALRAVAAVDGAESRAYALLLGGFFNSPLASPTGHAAPPIGGEAAWLRGTDRRSRRCRAQPRTRTENRG